MNIQLSPALDSFVTRGVRDGVFASANAAVEEGLGLLLRQKGLKARFSASTEVELLNKLDAGLASLDGGLGIPSAQAFATLRDSNR